MQKYTPYLLAAFGLVLWLPGLGSYPLFDWDTINFAECAREMLETDDYLRVSMAFRPYYEKPPLYFWLQAASMRLFGINDFAAQLPNVLCGISTLLLLFGIGKRHFGYRTGLFWALAYAGSLLPTFYFRHGFIDPVFNLFIFLSLYFLIRFHWQRSGYTDTDNRPGKLLKWLALAGFFTGLGILTKGPVALLLPALCLLVYWVRLRFRFFIQVHHALFYVLVSAATAGLWFGADALVNGPEFAREFFVRMLELASQEDAGHGGFPGYHFVVLLLGCFPASILVLPVLFRKRGVERLTEDFRIWMLILLGVVLAVFTLVNTKIIHYSSLAYFPITFLAAYAVDALLEGRLAWKRWQTALLLFFGGLFGLALVAAPFLGMDPETLIPLIKDPFAKLNFQADAGWTGWEALVGLGLLDVVVVSAWWLGKGRLRPALLTLFLGTAVGVQLICLLFVPKVLTITQGAAVEFYQGLQGKPVYTQTLNYKSYAQYWYARLQPPPPGSAYLTVPDLKEWLKTGPIDRDAYFSAKLPDGDHFRSDPGFEVLYEKNGFLFIRRRAVNP